MSDEKKIALVTGGAGFIGSFLCEALLQAGRKVICIDDFTTGNVRNIEGALRNPDFQFLRLNINEPFDLEGFPELLGFKIKFLGIDEIYHLATPTSIKNFNKLKHHTLLTNSVGVRNILDIAVKYKSKVLLASSSVVYGGRKEDIEFFAEDYQGIVDHLSPRACYDEGKRFAETMFSTYGAVYGLDVKIARIFRTYGPRMPLFDGHQIPDFILNALNGDDLIVNVPEDFKTSIIYVSDVVSGLMKLMSAEPGIGPVNFGSDQDLLLVDIAKMIIEKIGSTSQIKAGEEIPFLTDLGLPDISKAKEKLEWMPIVRLEDGLQKTIEYIRANKILLTGDTYEI
ncbi:NAD-dependent epimerase/dehydratase family protein [Candidatus Parcubacteria bacterium]|nr:MAG: NAD-dependent epimerase/dehydratase family protein [Candidatus Parcubacteria bacterium]